MLDSKSVKNRLAVSLAGNGIRAVFSFLSGLVIARALQPVGYGELMFLLGSFVALRQLLDLGTSNAFYTFSARSRRGRNHYILYFGWLVTQFVLTSTIILIIFPDAVIQRIWLGHSRAAVLLAFGASFLQQQVWQTVGQIGEASRKTVRVQLMNVVIASTHLIAMLSLSALHRLSLSSILIMMMAEYAVAAVFAGYFLHAPESADRQAEKFLLKDALQEYRLYCTPLVALSVVSFLYDFADRWMLQRFGGARQQGFYQIAFQFAAVSLLATTSILNVLWKEIAEAHSSNNHTRVALLYRKTNRILVIFGAFLSALLIPWTREIVAVTLGQNYVSAAPVLAFMFLYPIHQAMGQVGGTIFLATGRTRTYTLLSASLMLASIPVSYLVQAPRSAAVPGFQLGAKGMAIKMVAMGIFSVNLQSWLISRYHGWKFEWIFQLAAIASTVTVGFVVKFATATIWTWSTEQRLTLIAPAIFYGATYAMIIAFLSWFSPCLLGVGKSEVKEFFSHVHAK